MMNAKNLSTHWIRDLDTLRVISDPLRAQIFDLCVAQPRTVREMAGLLGLTPTRLYYHINLLERHGLIVVDETRTVGNLIEKRYRTVATALDIDSSLFNIETHQGKENMFGMVRSTLDSTRDDLLRSVEARAQALAQGAPAIPREVLLNHIVTRLSEERAAEFLGRFKQLMEEFNSADTPQTQPFAMTLAYYPVFYYPDEETGTHGETPTAQQ